MASFRIVRFSKGRLLRRMKPENLLRLLEHPDFRAFLQRAGIDLPADPDPELIPYDRIAEAFMELDPKADRPIIDALYYLDSFARDSSFDELVAAAVESRIIPRNDDPEADRENAMDLVVRVWLHPHGRAVMTNLENTARIQSFRSFRHFSMAPGDDGEPVERPYSRPDEAKFKAAAAAMRPLFQRHRRGGSVTVRIAVEDDAEVWFQIIHGESLHRSETINDDDSSGTVVFRPKDSDVVIYNKEIGELRTNVGSVWQLKLYREQFGIVLFDAPEAFDEGDKYDMEKFRTLGRRILDCSEIEGIDAIELREVEIIRSNGGRSVAERTRCKEDLYDAEGWEIPSGGHVVRISFGVKFTGSADPRTVTVVGGSRLILAREEDTAPVEAWLCHHEVVNEPAEEEDEDE